MKKIFYFFAFVLSINFSINAQTNGLLNGYIAIQPYEITPCDLSIEATITIYSFFNSINQAPDSILINWGDGSQQFLSLENQETHPNELFLNVYKGIHSYPSRQTYSIRVSPCCLGFPLVNLPNAESESLFLSTEYDFLNPQFQGCNSTPIFLQPPLDIGLLKNWFIFNLNAFDQEGDSLSYSFDIEFMEKLDMTGVEISINEPQGEILFRANENLGNYVFRICVTEYRFGNKISETCFPLFFRVLGDDFLLYPNPSRNHIFINLVPFSGNESFDLKIYDAAAKLIYLENDVQFQNIYSIDIQSFAKGGYILVFESGKHRVAKKFIKN